MANEHSELEAAMSMLIDEMEGDLGDRHEIWLRLQTLLQQIRATGMPVPDDLQRMEDELEAEFGRGAEARQREHVRRPGAAARDALDNHLRARAHGPHDRPVGLGIACPGGTAVGKHLVRRARDNDVDRRSLLEAVADIDADLIDPVMGRPMGDERVDLAAPAVIALGGLRHREHGADQLATFLVAVGLPVLERAQILQPLLGQGRKADGGERREGEGCCSYSAYPHHDIPLYRKTWRDKGIDQVLLRPRRMTGSP
jgi:hypothetical protein